MGALAFILQKGKAVIDANAHKQRITTYVLSACLLIAFISENFFGVADITGAYLLGLFLSKHEIKREIGRKMNVVSYLFFSPVFFASVGLKVDLKGLTGSMLIFSLILLVIAILTKIVGCGLGARVCGFSKREALQVGIGMISRGEVALIVAQKGYDMGLMSSELFPPIVLVVITTTIITPILLKKAM
jgi:Kef-type K+ transport system membrane component KefB